MKSTPAALRPAVRLFCLVLMALPAAAATNYVSQLGAHVPPFTNWVNAATNIQPALDVALPGSIVLVSDGVYRLAAQMTLTTAVRVTSLHGAASTMLRGGYPLTFNRCALVTSGGILDGFTVTNGYVSGASGGGVYCENGGVVQRCVVSGNVTAGAGWPCGGGICCENGGTALYCIVSGNTAAWDGGGVYCDGSGFVRDSLITGNSSYSSGAGVQASFGGSVLNCTVVGNDGYGIGLIVGSMAVNCITWYNSVGEVNKDDVSVVQYTCSSEVVAGTGNIASAPRFAFDSLGNFRLSPSSPCRNAGTNLPDMATATDLDGRPRTSEGCVDMGAYEFTNVYHYVWPGAPASAAPYDTWDSAATTIQEAVDAAWDGDVVWVTNGLHASGSALTPGAVSGMLSRVVVTQALILASVNGAASTIIQGWGPGGTNGPGAIRGAYLANGALLTGFTITNGRTRSDGTTFQDACGGGVFLEGNARMLQCVVAGNSAIGGGGGAFGINGSVIEDADIRGNSAASGGGLFFQFMGSAARCRLVGNSAGWGGGAFCSGNCELFNCLITGNSASFGGGMQGIGAVLVVNCTMCGNNAVLTGGGMSLSVDGTCVNCIIQDNTAMVNSNYYSDTTSNVSWCCTAPLPAGPGNIETNPLFAGVADWHLQFVSPCVDAGTSMAWMANATDLDGNPRILGPGVDMGCYETVPEPAAAGAAAVVGGWLLAVRRRSACEHARRAPRSTAHKER